MKKRASFGLLFAAVGALALIAAGCGGGEREQQRQHGGGGGGSVTALPASSCGPLQYKGDGQSRLPDRDGPADAGWLAHADGADGGGDRLRARPAELEGRRLQHRLPGLRRLDCPARRSGIRTSAARTPTPTRQNSKLIGVDRHVQLRLRRDRDPGAEPGTGRRAPAALAGQHVRLPDRAVRGRRAGEVLPERQAQRTRALHRAIPNQGAVDAKFLSEQGRQERLHPERQGGVRPRRREELRGRGQGRRHEGHGLHGLRPEGGELPGDVHEDQGNRTPTRSSSAA